MKVLLYGFGEINRRVVSVLLKKGYSLSGIVDISPSLVGKSAKEIIAGVPDVKITDKIESKPDIIIHATSSHLKTISPQILECVNYGHVISTCEELVFPIGDNINLAKKIDEQAKKNKKVVLAIGVNPGFIMDAFVAFLINSCESVDSVSVGRYINSRKRRAAFQAKIVETGHIGLKESAAMLAAVLGWKPRIVEKRSFIKSNGKTIGIQQVVKGYVNGREKISLHFKAANDVKERDVVEIVGSPNIKLETNGLHGDIATASLVVNAIPKVLQLAQHQHLGLVNVLDLPIYPRWLK